MRYTDGRGWLNKGLFYASHNICFTNSKLTCGTCAICYTVVMTKLLDEAVDRLRQLPESVQDVAARALMRQLEEQPEPGDLEAIKAGWDEYQRGDFVTHEQFRHEMGLGDR